MWEGGICIYSTLEVLNNFLLGGNLFMSNITSIAFYTSAAHDQSYSHFEGHASEDYIH